MSSPTKAVDAVTETRAERIARYKEQRRKQLHAQYGGAKDQNGATNPGSNSGVTTRKDASVSAAVSESPIRTTRTSRLRAAAAAAAASLSGTSSNGSSEYLGLNSPSSPRLETSLPKEKSPVTSRLEKDKSAKRKSNLNRSTCSEEIADQNDDKYRRRRRRFFPPDIFNNTTRSSPPSQSTNSTPSLDTTSTQSSLTSLLSTTNQSSLSSLPRICTPSSHLASPIAVATAVAVSIASPSTSTSTRGKTQNHQQQSIDSRTKGDHNNIQQQSMINVMGGVVGKDGRGDVNRMGAVRKLSGSAGSAGSVKGKEARIGKKSVGGLEVVTTSSPSSTSNKENIRTRRLNTNKPPDSLGRRLNRLTTLTQDTLAKVKSLEMKQSQNNYTGPLAQSRSESKSPSVEPKAKSTRSNSKPSSAVSCDQPTPAPVSILKRKVSQEECKTSLQTPPVTFSPSVIDPPVTTSKRQGILKKRRSLDESQVMRHRSCSPDKSDSRSILKNQKRRSSLEELARRVNSPETIPGILKRKTLKHSEYDDLMDNTSLNSPQSILKRKSGASSAGSMQDRYVPHVSIATAVILAAADGAEMILDQTEHVKPILKKKSFSEECCSGNEVINSYGDGLKPILKKKSSTDTDDCTEDRPKRPILKLRSFQQDSLEYYDCTKSRSSLNNDSGSECEVKPILKSASEQYKPRLSFCEGTNEQVDVFEQLAYARLDNNDSGSDSSEFKPILKQQTLKDHHQKPRLSFCSDDQAADQQRERLSYTRRNSARRSNTICSTEFNFGDRRVIDKEADRELQKPRTLSVLELVQSFETTTSSGAIPKKSNLKRHSSERFKTQPITMHELQASGHISNQLSPTLPINLYPDSPLSPITNFNSLFNLQGANDQLQLTNKNLAQSKSDTELLLSLPNASSSLLQHNKSTSSELYSSSSMQQQQQEQLISTTSISCVLSERSGGVMSSDSAFQSLGDGLELVDESSSSGAEEKEVHGVERFSGVIRVMPPTPPGGVGGVAVQGRRQTKGKSSCRFSSQPVTTEEVAEAAKVTNSEEEFEPANLSIMDKIKLFKMKTIEDLTLNVPKRRENRRFTQPVTIDEVEIAKKKPDKPKIDSESSPSENIKPILKSTQFKLPASPRTPSAHLKLPSANLTLEQTIACDEGISSDSGSDSESTRSANRVARRNAREIQNTKLLNSALESNSDESSGGKEIQSIISKEAMAAVKKRRENLIFKSKSQAALPSSPKALSKLHLGRKPEGLDDLASSKSNAVEGNSKNVIYRSVTQSHLAPKGCALDNSSSAIAMRRNMICELQQQLAQSGNSDWLKRRHKLNGASEELSLLQANNERNEELNGKPSILAAKLDELDASSKTWKTRVEKSDAVNFSVAGKMQENDVSLNIPTPDKHKRTPQPKRFKGKQDYGLDTSITPVTPDLEKNGALKRSISVQPTSDQSVVTPNNTLIVRTVKINRPDDETFSSFFENTVTSNERVEIDDLDCVTRESSTLLVQKKNIQVIRRRVASRNPVKTLAKRADLRSEYTEVSTGVIERETKRLNMERLIKSPSCTLAMEALAGLASKEDFSSVVLKKSSEKNPSQYLPYSDVMLLQIKGRKHIQTRLVEPTLESINFGDNYLLITPNRLYYFAGTYSNVIEQSRAQDIANYILQTADLGCKSTRIVNIDVTKPGKDLDEFKRLLNANDVGEDTSVAKAGNPNEDEIYESSIIQTNMIYKMENDELVPYDEYWGAIPKIAMLDEKQCLVFDFGSEMYIWSGKSANRDRKKITLRLANELWSTGYNYTDCSVCPINVSKKLGSRTSPQLENDILKGETRPKWALFAKLTQNRETILFKEKFLDWPDFTRVIRVKSPNREDKSSDGSTEIKPLEIPLKSESSEPDFIVENTSLGRGKEYFDEGTRRNFEISTRDVTCWNIMENTYEKLDENEFGHFYEGDTYIVRWNFRVTVTGKDLSGKPSKHLQLGRDRCCFFCWFGNTATTNEKGTAALLTVELDSENAKQYRITQEHEPPAFLQLFNGKMIIFKGKRDKKSPSDKLFMVRGHSVEESSLLEVPLLTSSLRSRTSFILQQDSSLKLWHGSKCLETTKHIAKSLAQNLNSKLKELFEHKGDVLLDRDDTVYPSLKTSDEKYDFTPRLFYFSSVTGSFDVTEVLGSDRKSDVPTPYPILQCDLYNENQPALFLLDNQHTLYLWHGWWPATDLLQSQSRPLSPTLTTTDSNPSSGSESPELIPSDLTGSARVRWHAERRTAMVSSVKYYQRRVAGANSNKGAGDRSTNEEFDDLRDMVEAPVKLIWAGLEPDEFVALFPTWDVREDVKLLNIKEDKVPGQITPLHEELTLLSRNRFTLEELQQRPLPIGVDPTHLETYLSDSELESLLKMSREDFSKLPTWKKTTVKKEHGLF